MRESDYEQHRDLVRPGQADPVPTLMRHLRESHSVSLTRREAHTMTAQSLAEVHDLHHREAQP